MVYPPVAGLLASIPAASLHHFDYEMRHPAAAYSVAFERLLETFELLLPPLQGLRVDGLPTPGTSPDVADVQRALRPLETMLYGAVEYLEACDKIVKSLFPRPAKKKGKVNAQPIVKQYLKEVQPYRQRVATLVNAIKHAQARIRPVAQCNTHARVPGFYLEIATSPIGIGPHPRLHDDGHTALSLFREIVAVFVWSLLVAESVESAALGVHHGAARSSTWVDPPKTISRIVTVAQALTGLPRLCYLNELREFEPLLEIQASAHGPSLIYALARSTGRYSALGDFRIESSFPGDGMTQRFQFPYTSQAWRAMAKRIMHQLPQSVRSSVLFDP